LVAGEPVRYGCLIGADGLASRVRSWAGLERGSILSRRFGFRQHFAVRPWSPYVEVHWSNSGQAYVTPVGPNEVCVATIARDSQCRLGNVLEEMPWLQEQLRGRRIEPVALDRERGAITATRRLRRVSRGRVALLGDASGSADAITGEGMAMSFRQALLLADCLAEKTPVAALTDYNRLHPKTVHLPQTIAGLMLGMDRSATFRNRAIRMLAAEPQLFARMLGVHVGSESLLRFIAAQGVNVVWRLAVPIDVKPAQSRLSV
jgi:2-polyprenyl-6-methoxyphenol hydroxylase-like FAD-dependent oxidoreductase